MAAKSKKSEVVRPPAEGERAARRGYRHQDRASARLAYEAMIARKLRWIGLADRGAGDVDDLVLGLPDEVVAHQFKKSLRPTGFGIVGLLLGKGSEIANLASAYGALVARHMGTPVRIHYFTNDYPSTSDTLIKGDTSSTTANFVSDWKAHPRRSLKEWRATRWKSVIDELAKASGLADPEFEAFWLQLELVSGGEAQYRFEPGTDAGREKEIEALALAISTLVADNPQKDRWSRDELLHAVGWPDRFTLRFTHDFPVGAWVQRNAATEARLGAAMGTVNQGYVSLVGPPGAGKSTLLAREFRQTQNLRVARYLAFMPDTAQGQGRGEADAFYHDLSTQLIDTGLEAARLKDDTTHARREHFEQLLAKAHARFTSDGIRTVIVVDGLDHIPREEFPAQSLLTALPLPQSVPQGILFVLGTQRLDLPGMPPAVAEQAGAGDRRIDIAPLGEDAVAAMADAAGLDGAIDRADVHRVGGGHPLATHYLIERLLVADPAGRVSLLGGELGEGGDLEAVYRAAWRWIDKASDPASVKKVLALVAHAQGPIEPELLAEATNDAAVEAALQAAGHLLLVSGSGWSVFHNSFRLFVQRQPVLRFGKPDPDFQPEAIYRRLGALVNKAPPDSSQRWLRLRYAYLAGDHAEALAMATRAYFVGQYLGGRDRNAVRGDINDCYGLIEAAPDPVRLFDLMLAQDEIERRSAVMESAATLIDAWIELGDLDAAMAALHDIYEDGKQWLVIDALLDDGRTEEARRLFEAHSPFRELDSQHRMSLVGEFERRLAGWSHRAVLFLDIEQIEDELAHVIANAKPEFVEEFETLAHEAVALAFIGADPHADPDGLSGQWRLGPQARITTALVGADAALAIGDAARATELLVIAAAAPELADLHSSWSLAAARVASRLGNRALAERFLAHAPLYGPGNVQPHHSEQFEDAANSLIGGIIVRTALGIPFNSPKVPNDRVLKGIQHHLVAIATAFGELRAGRPVTAGMIAQLADRALTYLASAKYRSGDDDMVNHRLPMFGGLILDLLYDLCDLAHLPGSTIAATVAKAIEEGAVFRHWPEFRRSDAVMGFELDQDSEAAAASLEAALADLECTDPREEVEERTGYAAAFARIGKPERARNLIADLRGGAFGVYLPAKKDAQYQMWTDLLALANAADPNGRGRRAIVALNLVEGLQETEGYDMARRMVRQVLFETAAADTETAAMGFAWAMETGSVSWDGAVDALLRGWVTRDPARCRDALRAWCALCLPWYDEPHGSTQDFGCFLSDLMAVADAAILPILESEAIETIATQALPELRLRLMRVLETAAAKRGGGVLSGERIALLAALEPQEEAGDGNPRNQSYAHLVDFEQIVAAMDVERAYNPAHGPKAEEAVEVAEYEPGWNLRAAIARVVANSTWAEIDAFARFYPTVMAGPDIALAAARVAVAAGEKAAAESLLAGSQEEGREGWSWPSDRGTLRRHEARHLLGFPHAHRDARHDFLHDLASNRYGVAGILWSTDRIFPILFEETPWPRFWELLEAQLRLTRDFQRSGLLERVGGRDPAAQPATDTGLLVELFVQAFTLQLQVVGDCAARGACALLELGNHRFFGDIVEALLDHPHGVMAAADLLVRGAESAAMRERFTPRLEVLASHDDAAIVGSAFYLSGRWREPIAVGARPLPAFYQISLPEAAGPQGAATDPFTGGMVLDNPMEWTSSWEREVDQIAHAGGVSTDQVRWRVAQLIQGWGGIARYGHIGSKALDARLKRLQIRLPYQFPHVTGVLRALRHVAAELFHAKRMTLGEFTAILYKLYADPSQPMPPVPTARPGDVPSVRPPRLYRDGARAAWLDAVGQDLPAGAAAGTLAAFQRTTNRETRETMAVETLSVISPKGFDPAGSWATLTALPSIVWSTGTRRLYEERDAHPSRIAIFRSRRVDRLPELLLTLCPFAADALGWRREPGSIDRFVDTKGTLMAWTIWWRDGIPQPLDRDERQSEGQRVCLSVSGLATFEARYGAIALVHAAWHRATGYDGENEQVRFARSDLEPAAPVNAPSADAASER